MATDTGDGDDDEGQSLSERIKGLRDRVQRKQREREADRRASARRVEKGDPETTGERVAVAKNEAAEAANETKGLASDAVELVSAEFGVSGDQAAGIIQESSDLLSAAGQQLDKLDADGDGDTDILTALDEGVEASAGRRQRQQKQAQQQGNDPPVGGIEDDFNDVEATGVEAEVGLDFPIEEDL